LGERIVVLYAGNLGVKQAIGSLLDAAALLRSDPRIVFVVVGDGGEKTGLEARARQEGLHNVMFRPLQPLDRLSELLATADVAVIPQKRGVTDIVLPSKLCNILSSACPVVTAAPAGSELAEIVRAAECGIVVEPENAPQLAAAIARFAEAPALRTRCGCSGRRYMEVHLGHTPILERFRGDLLALARRAPSDQPRTAAR
jgi:colanic acid biosynthesis glycosyl transferase WcaI